MACPTAGSARTSVMIDLAHATLVSTVRSIALVGFVTLTAVATVLGNIPLVR